MTINAYTPEQLDLLSLRFFDLAAHLRAIARQARGLDFQKIPIHDRKALQWCENLESWVNRTEMNFRIAVQEQKVGGLIDPPDEWAD